MRYLHVCLETRDWRKLSKFYQDVFGCVPLKPQRDYTGEWIESLWGGIDGLHVEGEHIGVPGYYEGFAGPTLEIFQTNFPSDDPRNVITACGLAHVCFEVDNVSETLTKILENGGSLVSTFPDPYNVRCVFTKDPDGNVLEIHLP